MGASSESEQTVAYAGSHIIEEPEWVEAHDAAIGGR
jgi:hypothetical protein